MSPMPDATILLPELLLRAWDRGPEAGMAVLVQGGRIAAIDASAALGALAPEAETIDLAGSILMPGLVNAHQHGRGVSQIQLGYPDRRLELWMAQRRSRRPPDFSAVTLLAAAEMLKNGVTCAVHADLAYGTGDYEAELRGAAAGYAAAGLRSTIAVGVLDQGAIVFPQAEEAGFLAGLPEAAAQRLRALAAIPPYAPDWPATVAMMGRLEADYAGDGLVRFCYGPSGPQWVSDGLFAAVAEDAARRGAILHIHALETVAQFEACRRLYPQGTVRHLRSLGAVGPRTVFAHGVFLTDDDIAVLAEADAMVATNPGSNLRLCDATARVSALVAAGVRVGVGSDNTTLMDDEDLFSEARLASRLVGRRTWSSPDRPTGPQVLKMLTVDGAAAAGWAGEVGRIAEGWRADLVAMSLARVRTPYLDPDMPLAEALVARGRGADVTMTMVAGRVLFRDGRFPHLDHAAIAEAAGTAAAAARLPAEPGDVALTELLRPRLADFYASLTAATRFPDELS